MLSDETRAIIRLEESYRDEVKKELAKPTSFMERIDGPLKILQASAIAFGIIFSILQYRANSRQERFEAAREYQKSFYQAQMNVYTEAVNAAAIISTNAPNSESYQQGRSKFLELFWGRMSMFEDKCVEAKMIAFRRLLVKYENSDTSLISYIDPCTRDTTTVRSVRQFDLQQASLRLAHQCRIYTIKTWLPGREQENYNQ